MPKWFSQEASVIEPLHGMDNFLDFMEQNTLMAIIKVDLV